MSIEKMDFIKNFATMEETIRNNILMELIASQQDQDSEEEETE